MGFQSVIENLAAQDNRSDGDYIGENGLLYCGQCHTAKQSRICWLDGGEERVVPVVCKCQKEQETEAKRQQREAELELYIDALRRDGMTDEAYFSRTFAADDGQNQKVSDLCRRYVAHWKEMRDSGQGLLFYGGVGTGKSFYACAIANALLEQCVTVMVTNFPRILARLQEHYGSGRTEVIRQLQRYDLLVIDDLGVERSTSTALESLYQVIDARLLSRKPLIVTTNLSPEDLNKPENVDYGRIYDRLKEMCLAVKVDGVSRRTAIAAQNRKKVMEVLGYEQP